VVQKENIFTSDRAEDNKKLAQQQITFFWFSNQVFVSQVLAEIKMS